MVELDVSQQLVKSYRKVLERAREIEMIKIVRHEGILTQPQNRLTVISRSESNAPFTTSEVRSDSDQIHRAPMLFIKISAARPARRILVSHMSTSFAL